MDVNKAAAVDFYSSHGMKIRFFFLQTLFCQISWVKAHWNQLFIQDSAFSIHF